MPYSRPSAGHNTQYHVICHLVVSLWGVHTTWLASKWKCSHYTTLHQQPWLLGVLCETRSRNDKANAWTQTGWCFHYKHGHGRKERSRSSKRIKKKELKSLSETMDEAAPLLCKCSRSLPHFAATPASALYLCNPNWMFSTLDIQFELSTQIQAVVDCLTCVLDLGEECKNQLG